MDKHHHEVARSHQGLEQSGLFFMYEDIHVNLIYQTHKIIYIYIYMYTLIYIYMYTVICVHLTCITVFHLLYNNLIFSLGEKFYQNTEAMRVLDLCAFSEQKNWIGKREDYPT